MPTEEFWIGLTASPRLASPRLFLRYACIFFSVIISTGRQRISQVNQGRFVALSALQMLIWIVIPNLSGSTMTNIKNLLRFIIIFRHLLGLSTSPRFLVFSRLLSHEVHKITSSPFELVSLFEPLL